MDEGTKETRGVMKKRHFREEREMKARVAALQHGCKKSAPKAERDEVARQCRELAEGLERRHAQELASLNATEAAEHEAKTRIAETEAAAASDRANAALQRRQEQRAEASHQRTADAAARLAELRIREGPSAAEREDAALLEKLTRCGFSVRTVPADGQCLFASLADQLAIRRGQTSATALTMREMVVSFISEHSDDFAGFIDDVIDGEVSKKETKSKKPKTITATDKIRVYCEKLRDPAMWGGHVEIVAAVRALGITVVVHTADSDDLVVGPDYGVSPDSPLHISFHKHAFTLGEHYNSVVDIAH